MRLHFFMSYSTFDMKNTLFIWSHLRLVLTEFWDATQVHTLRAYLRDKLLRLASRAQPANPPLDKQTHPHLPPATWQAPFVVVGDLAGQVGVNWNLLFYEGKLFNSNTPPAGQVGVC